MRHLENGNIRYLLIVALVAATLGMVADVCSGPLPAQDGLAVLLDLLGPGPEPGGDELSDEGDGPRGERRQPRSSVSVADWPVPVLVVKCRPHAKRRATLAPGVVATPGARAQGARPCLVDRPPALRAPSPVRLCRLNC